MPNWDVSVSLRGVDRVLTSKIDVSLGAGLQRRQRQQKTLSPSLTVTGIITVVITAITTITVIITITKLTDRSG